MSYPLAGILSDTLAWHRHDFLAHLVPFEIDNLRNQIVARQGAALGSDEPFQLQCRNLARNRNAGMIIGMGTDSGVSVAWTTHTELRDMVSCGLTPMEAITAATSINAAILGLDDLGMITAGRRDSRLLLPEAV